MAKAIVWTVVFGFIAAVLQSTLLARLAVYGAVPDIALGIIVYSAYVNGVMIGQLSGFFYGFALDILSASPPGLNSFIRTLIGALAGLMKGKFFLDAFLLPMVLCAAATILKAAILYLLNFLFLGAVPSYSFTAPVLWAETALNAFIAPFLFALLKQFSSLLTGRKKT